MYDMSQPSSVLRCGEFFSGPGGMSLGVSQATGSSLVVEHKWAVDIDADAVSTYNLNIAPVAVQADVRELDVTRLSPIDLFCFGFPCNDFSVVGEKLGINGSYGPLYSFGVSVLDHHQPLAFIAENVSGLSSANEGQTFRTILDDLASAGPGYTVVPHLYNAEDYGVPQSRKRILIVGIRTDVTAKFLPPAPLTGRPRTVRDALITSPIPEDSPNHERTKQSRVVIERLKYIRPGENAFTATLPDELKLNVAGAKISQIYRRLLPDKPAYTITGSGGGGTHVYHWEENRALTNRERARLQSFPDDFVFVGSKESVRKQIGMAVPPDLARAVAKALLDTLEGTQYPSVNPNMSVVGARLKARQLRQQAFAYEQRTSYK